MKNMLVFILFLFGSSSLFAIDKEIDNSPLEIFNTVVTIRHGTSLVAPHSYNQICTGAIISSNTIVTAAHCFEHIKVNRDLNLRVHDGDHYIALWNTPKTIYKLYKIKPENIVFHTEFSPYIDIVNSFSDIAIIKIDGKFPEWVVPATIEKVKLIPSSSLFISGGGGHANRGLIQTAEVQVSDNNEIYSLTSNIKVCKGDSGGPLFSLEGKKFKLFGVLSYINDISGFCGNNPFYTFGSKLYDFRN